MKTKTLGELLREARERAGIDLATLESMTRIKQQSLKALENNDFAQLPSVVFVKGYISSYARALEIDPMPLLAILRRDFTLSTKGQLRARELFVPSNSTRFIPRPVRMAVVTVLSLSLALALYVGWQWYLINLPPSVVLASPSEMSEVGGEVSVTGRTKPDVQVLINGQSASLKPDGFFTGRAYFPKSGIASIVVEAKDHRGKKTTIERQVLVKTN